MGQVIKTIKGRDNFVSASNVEYVKNNKKVVITRLVNKLYPVELTNNEAEIKLKFADKKYISLVKNIYS